MAYVYIIIWQLKCFNLMLVNKEDTQAVVWGYLKNSVAAIFKIFTNNLKQVVRKAIARTLTVLNEQRRTAAKDAWKKKRHTPTDLRVKGTKASRTGLTKHQKALQTPAAAKKSSNFKLRKFAVAKWDYS